MEQIIVSSNATSVQDTLEEVKEKVRGIDDLKRHLPSIFTFPFKLFDCTVSIFLTLFVRLESARRKLFFASIFSIALSGCQEERPIDKSIIQTLLFRNYRAGNQTTIFLA